MRIISFFLALSLMTSAASASEVTVASADSIFGLPAADSCFDSTERIGNDLEGYKARVLAVQDLVNKADGGLLRSTISFSEPVDVATARSIVEGYGITPRLVVSHSKEPDGKTATAVVRAGQISVQAALSAADPSRERQALVFRGIVSIVGSVPKWTLPALQADPRVYLVDITSDRQVTKGTACGGYVNPVVWQLYGLTQ